LWIKDSVTLTKITRRYDTTDSDPYAGDIIKASNPCYMYNKKI